MIMRGCETAPAGISSTTFPPAAITVPPCGPVTTSIAVVPSIPLVDAVIVADPLGPAAVASPDVFTVTTASSDEVHVKDSMAMTLPLASLAVAES